MSGTEGGLAQRYLPRDHSRPPANDAGLPRDGFEAEPWFPRFPTPADEGHKHDRGRVLVVSGRRHASGAARLAAIAALRSGAGLVTLVASPAAADICAGHLTTVMVTVARGSDELAETIADQRADVVIAGMGLEPDAGTRDAVTSVLASRAAAVLDAGALTAFEVEGDRLFELIGQRSAPTVLTPHAGEFERLFGGRSAIEASVLSNATVIRKGPRTRVATPDGALTESASGAPWLATAGSGDVLAGLVGGLLAQGMNARDAASAAVWVHGEAARRLGPGMIVDDLLPGLRPVIRDLVTARLARST